MSDPIEPVDEFDKAFAEIVAATENPPVAPPTEPVVEPVTPPVEPVVEPIVAPVTPPVEPVVEPADPPATPPTAPVAPVASPAPPAPVTPPPETPEAKTAREAFEASVKPYEPTAEEKAFEEKMKVDFPGEYATMMAKFKGTKQEINAQVHEAVQAIMKQVAPRLATVEQTAEAAAVERHVTALHTAHPDFDSVVPKVAEWIKTLPSYYQVGAQAVYDSGTTQDVIALIADYKKVNNVTTPVTPPVKPRADGAELAPVSSRRPVTTPTGEEDPNDFDSAFAKAAAALG